MRIVAGRLGGRTFASPHSRRTHPMSDKVRGALFNTLGDIDGLSFLDTFAGSGALGYEAASRGAGSVLLIENDKPAQRSILENITALQLAGQVKLVQANCSAWSDNNPGRQFDIVLLDPPFDHLQPAVTVKLIRHVEATGLYVLHYPAHIEIHDLAGLSLVSRKGYGDSQLLFYQAIGSPAGDLAVA